MKSSGAFLVLAALAGCGGAPPAPPPSRPPSPSASASAAPIEELAPAPFTAEQVRGATRNERRYTFRVEQEGQPTALVHLTFYHVDAEGARVSEGGTREDGTGYGVSPGRVTWAKLQLHGFFPKAATTITEETILVPAGKFACLVYTVKKGDGTVSRYYFAKDLPGAPVLTTIEKDGKRRKSSTLIEHTPGQ